MKVVDDLINKISTMNLKTVPRKSDEHQNNEARSSQGKTATEAGKNDSKIDAAEHAFGAYDNSLGNAIAPKGSAVSRTQRHEAQSWSLGRYQAVTESTTKLPILNYGSEAEFKTLNGKNASLIRTSQYGMAAMSWGIKEQVLNRYALTAIEEVSKRNVEYYSNSHSLAEQAAAELANVEELADDCNDIAEEMNVLNEFAQTVDELETSLSEGDLSQINSYELDLARRPGMDEEPALLTIEHYEPKARAHENLQDWDESISFAQLHPSEFVSDEFDSIDIDKSPVDKLIELAQSADTPPEILERMARSSNFDVRWATAGNPSTPLMTIWTFVADVNPAIRYLVADSSLVSSEVLEVLSEDPDPYVSARALKTLNRLRTRKLVKAQFGANRSQGDRSSLRSTGTDGRTSELRLKAVFSRQDDM